jgi:hypothetical protein
MLDLHVHVVIPMENNIYIYVHFAGWVCSTYSSKRCTRVLDMILRDISCTNKKITKLLP